MAEVGYSFRRISNLCVRLFLKSACFDYLSTPPAGASRPWTSAGGAVASIAVKGSMILY